MPGTLRMVGDTIHHVQLAFHPFSAPRLTLFSTCLDILSLKPVWFSFSREGVGSTGHSDMQGGEEPSELTCSPSRASPFHYLYFQALSLSGKTACLQRYPPLQALRFKCLHSGKSVIIIAPFLFSLTFVY